MKQVVGQLDAFMGIIRAMDRGKYAEARQAEILIHNVLMDKKEKGSKNSDLLFSADEMKVIQKIMVD